MELYGLFEKDSFEDYASYESCRYSESNLVAAGTIEECKNALNAMHELCDMAYVDDMRIREELHRLECIPCSYIDRNCLPSTATVPEYDDEEEDDDEYEKCLTIYFTSEEDLNEYLLSEKIMAYMVEQRGYKDGKDPDAIKRNICCETYVDEFYIKPLTSVKDFLASPESFSWVANKFVQEEEFPIEQA